MVDLIEYVKAYARAHYKDGWDIIIECYSDAEIAELIGDAETPLRAVRNCSLVARLRREDLEIERARRSERA